MTFKAQFDPVRNAVILSDTISNGDSRQLMFGKALTDKEARIPGPSTKPPSELTVPIPLILLLVRLLRANWVIDIEFNAPCICISDDTHTRSDTVFRNRIKLDGTWMLVSHTNECAQFCKNGMRVSFPYPHISRITGYAGYGRVKFSEYKLATIVIHSVRAELQYYPAVITAFDTQTLEGIVGGYGNNHPEDQPNPGARIATPEDSDVSMVFGHYCVSGPYGLVKALRLLDFNEDNMTKHLLEALERLQSGSEKALVRKTNFGVSVDFISDAGIVMDFVSDFLETHPRSSEET